jgi:hypothetical protein
MSSIELLFVHNNIGLKLKESDFFLNIISSSQPTTLTLNTNSNYYEMFYVFLDNQAISISYKEQLADTQRIACYAFLSTLTIGFCDEAILSISNSKDKYERLSDETLIMIDAENKEYIINYTRAVNNVFFDEYILYIGLSKNNFDWLSPIEELQTGFIANLSFNGNRIGDLVSYEIKRLPQRSEFDLYKLGFNFLNDIELTKNLSYFYDLDLVYVKTEDYFQFKATPNHNLKIKTGFRYKIEDFVLSISGSLYKNNLFGFEDINFHQRSEHHFESNYGSIDFSLKYSF